MTAPTLTVRELTIAAARIRLILAEEPDPDKRAVLRDHAVEIIDECFYPVTRVSLGDALLAATVTA